MVAVVTSNWRNIKGYEGLYQVSDCGEIKSLDRKSKRKDSGFNIYKGKVLKQDKNNRGYNLITLNKNGVSKKILVHRIVAINFIENNENKKFVNHIDGDKRNNKVENLEWATFEENIKHAWETEIYKPIKSDSVHTAKLNSEKVKNIRKNTENKSVKELAEEYGVTSTTVSNVLNFKSWKDIK